MIIKFNFKEIEELNCSNEQNIQLLQKQIKLLNETNDMNDKVFKNEINLNIIKLKKEISTIQETFNEIIK